MTREELKKEATEYWKLNYIIRHEIPEIVIRNFVREKIKDDSISRDVIKNHMDKYMMYIDQSIMYSYVDAMTDLTMYAINKTKDI